MRSLGLALAVCMVGVAAGTANPAPTASQLHWTRFEIGVMISYDMITQLTEVPNPQHFCIGAGGDKNLSIPPAAAFNPTNLAEAPDQWVRVAKLAGANYTVYVAAHCSGFVQWPSKVYNYSLTQTPLADQDPVAAYFDASERYGVAPGLYITWNYNARYNVGSGGRVQGGPLGPGMINVTDAEYHSIALGVLTEVYTQYSGRVTEAWFDGGEDDQDVNALMAKTQPNAIYMQGVASHNDARVSGFETGFLPYPTWSRATPGHNNGPGSPTGPAFVPVEADTTVSQHDAWFWKPGQTYRPLAELQAVYANTVGANGNLLLGVMPNATGLIGEDQVALLSAFGSWLERCYGPASALAHSGTTQGAQVTLQLPDGAVVDRLVIQEDQVAGQQVANFTVEVVPPGGYRREWIPAGSGSSIGNKRIHFLTTGPTPATQVRVTVTATLDGAPPPSGVRWLNVEAREPCQ